MTKQYLPETYIKDKNLLNEIKKKPIKIQQAIAEAMSTNIAKHSFLCSHTSRENTEATLTDADMILSRGLTALGDFKELANIALEKNESFTITYENSSGKPQIEVPNGKYIVSLLRQIDGVRTVEEVIEAVQSSPKWKDKEINKDLIMKELQLLLTSLNRAGTMYLRHKSVPPYKTIQEAMKRVEHLYKK